MFVIAQRISTVRDADLILVLDDGGVAAQGRHEDLLRDSELYNQILGSQLLDGPVAAATYCTRAPAEPDLIGGICVSRALDGSTSEASAQRGGATVRRLLRETAEYRAELLLALGSILLGAGAQAAAPWLVSQAIDHDILKGDVPGLARTLVGLFAVYAFGAVATRTQIFQVGSVGQRLLASLRGRLFEHFGRLPLAF